MGKMYYDEYDYEEAVVRTKKNVRRDSFKESKKAQAIERNAARRDRKHRNSLTCALERM